MSWPGAVRCDSRGSSFFGSQNLSFGVFAAQEMGITRSNKLELTALVLDGFEL